MDDITYAKPFPLLSTRQQAKANMTTRLVICWPQLLIKGRRISGYIRNFKQFMICRNSDRIEDAACDGAARQLINGFMSEFGKYPVRI